MSVRVLRWIEGQRKVCEFIRSQTTGEENQEFKVQEIY